MVAAASRGADRRAQKKHRTYGSVIENAWEARLMEGQSIRDFLAHVGTGLVAHERYADGTLYFSGSVSPMAIGLYGIVPKRGWRPEIRRSRTLSLVVKGVNGEVAPRMTVDDALEIVRQGCIWKDIANVELVRVATTNGKATHVFVQFEGEIMARRYVNCVDAQVYQQRDTGRSYYVHGSQLNAYYEYEPQPGGAFDSLVWRNPNYIGLRSINVSLRNTAANTTRRSDVAAVTDEAALQTIEQALGGKFSEAVESVRRVDMETTGINLVVQVRQGQDVGAVRRKIRKALGRQAGGLSMADALLRFSRYGDSEVCDRTIWGAWKAAENGDSSGDDDGTSLGSTPPHTASTPSDKSRSPGLPAVHIRQTSGLVLPPTHAAAHAPLAPAVLADVDVGRVSPYDLLDRSVDTTDSSVTGTASSEGDCPEVQGLQQGGTAYEPEMCAYFFN